MAFVKFEDGYGAGASGTVAADGGDSGFSALEWTVVQVARRDAARWTSRIKALDRLLRVLVGDVRHDELASPRLEALRRTAVAVRQRGTHLPCEVLAAFHGAGFSRSQLATLIHSVEHDLVSHRQGRLA